MSAVREHIFAEIDAEIDAERERQDAKFGVCDHPMVPHVEWPATLRGAAACIALGIPREEVARAASQHYFREGEGTFAHIVVEETAEFVEACATHGDASNEARCEAVQNAAVWVAIVEAIDRKRAEAPQ